MLPGLPTNLDPHSAHPTRRQLTPKPTFHPRPQLAKEICQEQSPQKLLRAREMLYELLTNCIPAPIIMRTLTRELLKVRADPNLRCLRRMLPGLLPTEHAQNTHRPLATATTTTTTNATAITTNATAITTTNSATGSRWTTS